MEEIVYKEEEWGEGTDKVCPSCGAMLRWGVIPCPDGKPGCLVLHHGYHCSGCGKYWRD